MNLNRNDQSPKLSQVLNLFPILRSGLGHGWLVPDENLVN